MWKRRAKHELAVSYLRNGYWFYVCGEIPPHKDARKTDKKIISQYGTDISKFTRARRKKNGFANVHYIRHRTFFVILATNGVHKFRIDEESNIKDAREAPIIYAGYYVGYRKSTGGRSWHPSVRIAADYYRDLKAYFESVATSRSAEKICDEFLHAGFEA